MAYEDRTLWGIHAGRTGDADTLFHEHDVVALGWEDIGNLSNLGANREAFKARYAEVYPDASPGAIPVSAGQLFRFVHEMQVGDLVIYPSKRDRQVHIGEVTDDYTYNPRTEKAYPHHRSVKWLKSFPRTHFRQGALHEIGSAMSLFQVTTYADEFIAALEGKPVDKSGATDETVSLVAAEIRQTTSDFILKQLSAELKGHPLASLVANLLETMGYRTRVSPRGPDRGLDIVAHRDELGFEPPIVKVQVKSGEGSVGAPEVQALYGNIAAGEFGLFVTLGTFSKPAYDFAQGKSNLRLIDGDELIELILEHYDELDSRYKGLIPLKRVYIPEVLEESEE